MRRAHHGYAKENPGCYAIYFCPTYVLVMDNHFDSFVVRDGRLREFYYRR